MDKRIVLSSIALLSTSALLYIYQLHRSLSLQVSHETHSGPLAELTTNKSSLSSSVDATDLDLAALALPGEILHEPSAYTGIGDHASLRVSIAAIVPRHNSTDTPLLTQYLRFTMTNFSRFPQFYLMKFIYRSEQDTNATHSFDAAYIAQLDFVVGDVVNGAYRVVRRTPTQVVFAMVMPKRFAPSKMDGRLVVGLHDEGEETVFYSRTLQWKHRDDERTVLPLERGGGRWLHELASWWLLVEGTRYVSTSSEVI